jgi:cytochrome c-type biogenesis protein CcmE
VGKLLVPIALLLAGVGTLVGVSIAQGGIPELQVREVAAAVQDEPGKQVKVHGLLASIESEARPLRFTLKDKDDAGRTVAVELNPKKGRPDTFQVEYDVAVVGAWDESAGVFRADQIFTKCPSKYEGLEKTGVGSEGEYERRKRTGTPDVAAERPADGSK